MKDIAIHDSQLLFIFHYIKRGVRMLNYQNVTLRPLKETDFAALWRLFEPEIFEFMLHKVETQNQLNKWLQAGIDQMHERKALTFAVEHTDTKEIMGTTRIYGIDYTNKSCEIGSTFYGKRYQRTNVNTACKYLLLTYCFEDLQLIRVQLKTDEQNLSSQRAIERIGAKREGVLRNERIRSNGVVRNAVIYSFIDEEWEKTKTHLFHLMHKYT